MNAYGALASSYDGLTRDIPYGEILDFLETILQTVGRLPVGPDGGAGLRCDRRGHFRGNAYRGHG